MIIDTIRCGIEGESRNPPEDEMTEEQLEHMSIRRARYIKDSEMDSLADLSEAVTTLLTTNRELKSSQATTREAYDLKLALAELTVKELKQSYWYKTSQLASATFSGASWAGSRIFEGGVYAASGLRDAARGLYRLGCSVQSGECGASKETDQAGSSACPVAVKSAIAGKACAAEAVCAEQGQAGS
jgi:hypothetical protein